MEKEWYNKAPRAVAMLLHLKNYALENEDGNGFCTDVFGIGSHIVAENIDCLIDDYNRTKTKLARINHAYEIYHDGCMEWKNLGFDYDPSEYSEERQAELKALAERWQKEDDNKEAD